jgi:hypothetical protein
MSFRSSLQRFRPIIEQCESRDLTTAGLASLTTQVNFAPAHHFLAQENQAQGTYAFLRIFNRSGHHVRFQILAPIRNDRYLTNGLPGHGNGHDAVYYWPVTSQAPLTFTISFDAYRGLFSTENKQARSWTGTLPNSGLDQFIARNAVTYTFHDSGGQTVLRP